MGIYDITLYDIICRNARVFHDQTAWFEADDDRCLTFGQYKTRVDQLAACLARSGLQAGDRVGVLGKNSLEFFLVYGAAAALGAIVLPVNWRLSAEEVAYNLNDGTPAVLFVDEEYQPLIEGIKAGLSSVRRYVNLKGDVGGFERFTPPAAETPLAPANVGSEDGLVIIHTAAVAGRPRGALLSHGNLLNASLHLNYLFNLARTDIHLNLLPMFHIAGLTMLVNAFHAGALNVNMSRFDADRAVELIAEKGVSVLYEFTPILSMILKAQAESGRDIRSLKSILGLDTPETIEAYQKATGGTFYCVYGQTETTGLATLGRYDDCPGAAGRPISLADVRLVDDAERFLPVGQVGEIVVKGPLVFKGYWQLPADNARTFRGGWHHTGDLGRFDEAGFIWYAGRKADKELIKPGGENVYPAEVEKAILEHPDVDMAVVFGVPDPKWKEGIKAVCRLQPGRTLAPAELIRFVGERIASFKKPHYVEFVTEMPLGADGSPDRAKVKATYGGNRNGKMEK